MAITCWRLSWRKGERECQQADDMPLTIRCVRCAILDRMFRDCMHTRRDDPSIPAWSGDQLDPPSPPEIEPPYFDNTLNAWVLSRHADILAAFRATNLSPVSPESRNASASSDESARLKMRAAAMAALAPPQLRAWR